MVRSRRAIQEFIDLYNTLDDYLRKELRSEKNIDHSILLRMMAERNRIVDIYQKDFRMFSRIRNMLVHNPYPRNANPLFYPHEYVLNKYKELVSLVLNPPKALSIAVPGGKIYTAKLSTRIHKLMKIMVKNNYTHIPILKDNKLIGIFSENTLLSYLVGEKETIILKDATVEIFKDYIKPEKHLNEYFEFVARDALLEEIEEIFSRGMKGGKRVAVVYITHSGKFTEQLLGMITPWDLANKRPI
jgi:CBS domain-containing protein